MNQELPDNLYVLIASILAGALVGFVVGGFIARKAKIEIWISRDDDPGPFWRLSAGEVVTSLLALASLIAAIIFGVVTHKDAKDDETKTLGSVVHSTNHS
ncbi:hypothetical protein ACH4KU_29335 [Streptomyces althioticus]|uniref:hypothetical protein n=1 Tax=Streptomyces althioticus TaxID=83380 RepID=UPI0037B92164